MLDNEVFSNDILDEDLSTNVTQIYEYYDYYSDNEGNKKEGVIDNFPDYYSVESLVDDFSASTTINDIETTSRAHENTDTTAHAGLNDNAKDSEGSGDGGGNRNSTEPTTIDFPTTEKPILVTKDSAVPITITLPKNPSTDVTLTSISSAQFA